ncbi:NAD(P)/FAD-dependent oxidoreductase [Gordonia sp. CPCC 205515]|uniref:NAD(P)/FAD-dependent oxidoreductase n=1 Tax=Gordonia sp. CPCC 205515 TaxID=3140791 RepID=UPI003AF37B9D
METVDAVVVGAGVVGLAIARELSRSGREVIVLESEDAVGTQTSSRNSEVIHAGIYYPQGSRKARACVAGREQLYRYCAEHGVPHRRIGKLIVATSADQLPKLDGIQDKAQANGVTDLRLVGADELGDLEPALHAVGALLSPSTGIIDSHELMRSLRRDAEDAGAVVALRNPVTGGRVADDGTLVVEVGESGPVACRTLINSAGLRAWEVARGLQGFPAEQIPPRHLAKGNYYALAAGSAPFSRLIYPVPVDGGLGVHLTLDLGGTARFGPDVEWLDEIDYTVDPARADSFYSEIRRYWPELPDDSLHPDYAGIRPKVTGPGESAGDFVISGPTDHGFAGLINLFGIESPGLTSCLVLAQMVDGLLSE